MRPLFSHSAGRALLTLGFLLWLCAGAQAQVLDRFKIGKHSMTKQQPFTPHYHGQFPPTTLVQMANLIDIVEEGLHDDGILTIQQPSVWGQARMTLYRRDFEKTMKDDLKNFAIVLSARTARSDQAAFENLTSLSSSLSKPGTAPTAPAANITFDKTDLKTKLLDNDKMFQLLNSAFQKLDDKIAGKLGVEPTVYLDEKKRYLEHLNQIRRINLGDDNADSAGYGMFLVRMPASILPGEKTRENHGAQMMFTARHEFEPAFTARTFRNLVINDLIDHLTPVLYDIVLHDRMKEIGAKVDAGIVAKLRTLKADNDATEMQNEKRLVRKLAIYKKHEPALAALNMNEYKPLLQGVAFRKSAIPSGSVRSVSVAGEQYPIAPSQLPYVFGQANLALLAELIRETQDNEFAHAAEIRGILRRHLESAYDLMERGTGDPNTVIPLANKALLNDISKRFRSQDFGADGVSFNTHYKELFKKSLNDELRYTPLGALCWAIAVDASLLNDRLRDEIRRADGCNGFHCVTPVEHLYFHWPASRCTDSESIDSEQAFRDYVTKRWPIVIFAQDPVVDQQNIADAYSLQRELRFAVAYSFANGKINFNQMQQFMRKISQESETIALNRTVTAFSHGNDTFGWRFSPRYQNPPPEKTNLHVLGNMIVRGGPPRDFQLKHSKLEAGQRELTAIMLMPSFLNRVKIDVTGNWFKLTNPDDLRITTGRMLEQGRRVKQLTETNTVCDAHKYRPEDVQRLLVRLKQIDKMLPMQTHDVPIPYENNLGGFELFGQGNTALVPKLIGYEGVNVIDDKKGVDIFVYGKNFSIHETRVVAGGIALDPGDPPTVAADGGADGKSKGVSGTETRPAPAWSTKPMVEILSREVIRITIPSNANVSTDSHHDHRTESHRFVEVYVATPNGISNKLQVQATPASSKPPVPAPKVYSLKSKAIATDATWKLDREAKKFVLVPNPLFAPNDLVLNWDGPKGMASQSIYVRLKIVMPNKKVDVIDFNTLDHGKAFTFKDAAAIISGSDVQRAFVARLGLYAEELPQTLELEASVTIWHVTDKKCDIASQVDLNEKLAIRVAIQNERGGAQ